MGKEIFVTRPSMPPYEEYIEEIKSIWDTKWMTNKGPKYLELKDSLREYLECKNIELLVNGHNALELTLQGMKLEGEVITTPFTFISTTHSIARSNLKPVFCDIDPDTYTIDSRKISELITPKTVAIMPVHVYGNVCDVEGIEQIAVKHHLKVIYDAAHAFGVKYKNRNIASFGDASIFSFHATKVFNTIEGGAVCTSDEALLKKISYLQDFGILNEEEIACVGTNAKINEFAAAMGICNLRHVQDNIQERAKIIHRYQKNLDGIPGLHIWHEQENVTSNYAYFPIVIDAEKFGISRDDVFARLKENDIYSRKYFYPIANQVACYGSPDGTEKTPIAEKISKSVLTLPLYVGLKNDDIDRISEIIMSCRK